MSLTTAPVPRLKPSQISPSRFSSDTAVKRNASIKQRVQVADIPWNRQTAFGRSRTRSSTRSGSLGGGTAARGRTSRSLQRPSSARSAPNRSSQSPSSAIAIVPWARSVPKPRYASSGQPNCFCRSAGASTSSPSGPKAPTAAPWRSSRSATNSRSSLIGLGSRSLEVFAEQGGVQGLGALVVLPRPLHAAAERVERLGAARFGRAQPSIEHQVGEIAILGEAAQDRPHLADHEFEHRELLIEQMQDLLLQGATGHEVEHEHLALLADAIDASDALLDRHRIPRHVEIDQGVAELDVATFAARLGAKQHRHPLAERGNGGVLGGAAQGALEARESKAFPCQQVGEVFERLAVVDEDQLLLVRVPPQQVDERRLLAAGADGRPALRQHVPACMAAGEAPYGGGGRGRRRSGGAEKMLQREPVCSL